MPNFRKADYDSILHQLNVFDWSNAISSCDGNVQTLYDCILHQLHNSISLFVPPKRSTTKPKVPAHIRALLKEKKKLYSFRAHSLVLKNSYKQVSKLYDNAVSKWHDEIENNICTDVNPAKILWICEQQTQD